MARENPLAAGLVGMGVGLLGKEGAKGVEAMLAGASKPRESIFATVIGIGMLIFAAVGVVVQLSGSYGNDRP
jgi:membrane protein